MTWYIIIYNTYNTLSFHVLWLLHSRDQSTWSQFTFILIHSCFHPLAAPVKSCPWSHTRHDNDELPRWIQLQEFLKVGDFWLCLGGEVTTQKEGWWIWHRWQVCEFRKICRFSSWGRKTLTKCQTAVPKLYKEAGKATKTYYISSSQQSR